MPDRELILLRLVGQLQSALPAFDRAKLAEIIGKLVELRAPMGGQWQQLARVAASLGEVSLFRAALDLWVEALGGGPSAQYRKAAQLAELNDWKTAYEVLATLPETVPDPISHAYSRGTALTSFGRALEARPFLDRVTAARPDLGAPWLVLAMGADLARDNELADRIIGAKPHLREVGPAQSAPYFYALGKAYLERGQGAAAFEAFTDGAERMKTLVRYDRQADRMEAEQAILGYTAKGINDIARQQGEATARTIFVAGLPRSGTTLLEQVLTSHSTVAGGAESSRLLLLAKEVGGQSFQALAHHVETQGTAPAARLWDHWVDELVGASARMVDKTVTTSRYLGLAAALLPDAPLLWITRDPMDRAWSCFRTNFMGAAMPWSYDLEDIAYHFRLEDTLLQQWRAILGDRLLVVPYEELVAHPEQWIGRVLAHCGLSEEPQVYAPHENTRLVTTASTMQVRRSIHQEAVGSAAPHNDFLKPFVQAYYNLTAV